MEYEAAGCLFTNGIHVLAGYQPKKQYPCISGIGGKREGEEDPRTTALREMLEEIFEIYSIDPLIFLQLKKIEPQRVLFRGSYVVIVYSFVHLEMFLRILVNNYITSNTYMLMPTKISDLVLDRRVSSGEISHLCLLPLSTNLSVDKHFVEDLKHLGP